MSERAIELALSLPIRPKGQGRPRFDPRSMRAYTPPTTREYVETLRGALRERWGEREPLDGAVAVSIRADFMLPKRGKNRVFHVQRPDLDNIVKAVLDAMLPQWKRRKGERVLLWPGVFNDDAQVISLEASKGWSVVGDALSVNVWSVAT